MIITHQLEKRNRNRVCARKRWTRDRRRETLFRIPRNRRKNPPRNLHRTICPKENRARRMISRKCCYQRRTRKRRRRRTVVAVVLCDLSVWCLFPITCHSFSLRGIEYSCKSSLRWVIVLTVSRIDGVGTKSGVIDWKLISVERFQSGR